MLLSIFLLSMLLLPSISSMKDSATLVLGGSSKIYMTDQLARFHILSSDFLLNKLASLEATLF